MKKIYLFLLVVSSLFIFACKGKEKNTLIVPNGVPLISMMGLINDFDLNVVNGATELKNAFIKQEYDAIIAPINLGATLYNLNYKEDGTNYKLARVLTVNNLYIVSKKENKLTSLNDLEKETVYSFGEGGVPDTILKYVINNSGLAINIFNSGLSSVENVVQGYFVNDTAKYILCSEPYISNLKLKLGYDLNVLDLSIEAKKYNLDTVFQAGLFVKSDNSNNKDIVNLFDKNYKGINNDLEKYVNNYYFDTNTYPLLKGFGEDIVTNILADGGVSCIDAYLNKDSIILYLNILGINLINEGYFYEK